MYIRIKHRTSLRIRHSYLSSNLRSRTKSSNCSNKIKMSKSTTGCRIKSFIRIENMNVKKFRATKSDINIFSHISLKWIQKSACLYIARYRGMVEKWDPVVGPLGLPGLLGKRYPGTSSTSGSHEPPGLPGPLDPWTPWDPRISGPFRI